jgi:hypothetical protein
VDNGTPARDQPGSPPLNDRCCAVLDRVLDARWRASGEGLNQRHSAGFTRLDEAAGAGPEMAGASGLLGTVAQLTRRHAVRGRNLLKQRVMTFEKQSLLVVSAR